MNEKEMTVYKHTSPDGKVYIGITKADPDKRFNNGNGYKENELFFRDIKKYGWESFTHELLAVGLTVEDACHMEIELIREYDSKNPEKGYNMQDGGMYMSVERRLRKRLLSTEQKHRYDMNKKFYKYVSKIQRNDADCLIGYANMLATLAKQCCNSLIRDDLNESDLREEFRDVLGVLRFVRRSMGLDVYELKKLAEECEKECDPYAES